MVKELFEWERKKKILYYFICYIVLCFIILHAIGNGQAEENSFQCWRQLKL